MKSASIGSRGASRQQLRAERLATHHPQAGFSLLETLTALSILAIALTSLFQAHSTGLRTTATAEDYAQARILAHSLLAGALAGPGDLPTPADGQEGTFRWSVRMAAAREGWASVTSKNWRLHHIRVTVAWARSRRFELAGLKLVRVTGGS